MLKTDWFVRGSIAVTLHNLIAAADVAYLQTVTPAEFEQLLIEELRFLAPYDEEEEQEVEDYIHQHLSELYRFLQTLPAERQAAGK